MFNVAVLKVTIDSTLAINLGFFSVPGDALVTAIVNGVAATAVVSSGNSQVANIVVNLATPIAAGTNASVAVAVAPLTTTGSFGALTPTGSVTIRQVEVWIDRPISGPGFSPPISAPPPVTATITFSVAVSQLVSPVGASPVAGEALVEHINRNRHYYWGVLFMASIAVPSLRQDVDVIANAIMAHPELAQLYRLPLLAMEGTTALLLDTATETDAPELGADIGAGTLVQVLAPGAYGEVLKGLLQIPLDALHPLLQQVGTISPFGPFPDLPTGSPTSAATGLLDTASTTPTAATNATGGLPTP
jgi:hypothetical protein